MKTLKNAIEMIESGKLSSDEMREYLAPENGQFIARENNKNPGHIIFVREDGKVGFPTINSIPIEIGDTARGKIQSEEEHYFLFEVREIVNKNKK